MHLSIYLQRHSSNARCSFTRNYMEKKNGKLIESGIIVAKYIKVLFFLILNIINNKQVYKVHPN